MLLINKLFRLEVAALNGEITLVINADIEEQDNIAKRLYELQNCLTKVKTLARGFGHWDGCTTQVNEQTEQTKPLYITMKINTEKSDKLLNEIEKLAQELSKKVREYEKETLFQLKAAPETDAVKD